MFSFHFELKKIKIKFSEVILGSVDPLLPIIIQYHGTLKEIGNLFGRYIEKSKNKYRIPTYAHKCPEGDLK